MPSSGGKREKSTSLLEPSTGKRKKVHTARWDRCVGHVKKESPDYDPYAVCTGRMKRERAFTKGARDRAAKRKKEQNR